MTETAVNFSVDTDSTKLNQDHVLGCSMISKDLANKHVLTAAQSFSDTQGTFPDNHHLYLGFGTGKEFEANSTFASNSSRPIHDCLVHERSSSTLSHSTLESIYNYPNLMNQTDTDQSEPFWPDVPTFLSIKNQVEREGRHLAYSPLSNSDPLVYESLDVREKTDSDVIRANTYLTSNSLFEPKLLDPSELAHGQCFKLANDAYAPFIEDRDPFLQTTALIDHYSEDDSELAPSEAHTSSLKLPGIQKKYLAFILLLLNHLDIDPSVRGVTTSIVHATETIGVPISDDTIRTILKTINGHYSELSQLILTDSFDSTHSSGSIRAKKENTYLILILALLADLNGEVTYRNPAKPSEIEVDKQILQKQIDRLQCHRSPSDWIQSLVQKTSEVFEDRYKVKT